MQHLSVCLSVRQSVSLSHVAFYSRSWQDRIEQLKKIRTPQIVWRWRDRPTETRLVVVRDNGGANRDMPGTKGKRGSAPVRLPPLPIRSRPGAGEI